MKRFLFTFAMSVSWMLLPAHAAVWEAKNAWTPEYEEAFVTWVDERFHKEIFHDPEQRAIFGLALDCSDAIYAMRIIYAHENKLPFAINDPTGKRRYLSNEMTKWDGFRPSLREELDDGSWRSYKGAEYDQTDKLRAFIEYVSDVTSTLNLVNDTFPVALEDVRPGDMFLLPRNHAYIIKRVDRETGAMTTLSHSSPRAWRVMSEINDFPAEVPADPKKRDGYRRFKPVTQLRTPWPDIVAASATQWEISARLDGDREAFAIATQDALASIKEPLPARTSRLFASLCDYAMQRVDIVNHGLNYLERMKENNGRECMSIGEYAEYSTPGRDSKLVARFRVLKAMMDNPEWESSEITDRAVIEAIFSDSNWMSEEKIGNYCAIPFDIEGGRNMSLRELWRGLEAGRVVSDPHAPLDQRWGLSGEAWQPQCKSAKRSS